MPLLEKTRVEIYLPDLPEPSYQRLLDAFRQEITHTFGGSTLVRNLSGTYLSRSGIIIEDRVNLLYTDAFLDFDIDADLIRRYTEALQRAAFRALNEEAILIAVQRVCHTN